MYEKQIRPSPLKKIQLNSANALPLPHPLNHSLSALLFFPLYLLCVYLSLQDVPTSYYSRCSTTKRHCFRHYRASIIKILLLLRICVSRRVNRTQYVIIRRCRGELSTVVRHNYCDTIYYILVL